MRAFLALLCLALGACHTAGRAWRITPFDDAAEPDRVNLWPLAYHSGDQTSVLWPLFDVDDQGFALRPIVAKDGTGWSILWPLASFDTAEGEGWIGPFYRFGPAQGLFPIVNLGGSVSWIGPWWWTDESRGLFPVSAFGRTSYVGPIWWRREEGGTRGGLFPLAYFGSWGHVGPIWWTSGGFGIFPLFGSDEDLRHVGPIWWRKGGPFEGGLFPLVWWRDEGQRFAFFPFFSHDLRGETRRRDVLFGLIHADRGPDGHRRWALPLYYDRESPGSRDTAVLPLFYKRVRGDRADVYTLIGNRSVAPDDESFNLYPLWWSSRTGESSWRMLFPLFYFEREGEDRTLLTPLGGRGWNTAGKHTFTNVLGPLYHHSENVERGESRTAFLWPLFERHRTAGETSTRLAGLWSRTRTPEATDTSYAFWLGHARSTEAGSAHRLWPLYAWSTGIDAPDPLYPLALFGHREAAGRSSTHLFPLYSSTRSGEDREWNALLGLVHHDRRADGSRRWWAWPLVSSSTGRPDRGFVDALSLVGRHSDEHHDDFQLGFSLLYSSSRVDRPERRSQSMQVLRMFSRGDTERLTLPVPTADDFDLANRVRHEWTGFALDLFTSERDRYLVWNEGVLTPEEARVLGRFGAPTVPGAPGDGDSVRRVLAEHGVAVPEEDGAALTGAIRGFADANTSLVERREIDFWPLWDYERRPDSLRWSAVLGLASYDRDVERSRFHFLWYGYRRETRGDRTTRDIFPFLTWDSGPGELEWSFLWRLVHYERKGPRRGGHVLFLPIGDV